MLASTLLKGVSDACYFLQPIWLRVVSICVLLLTVRRFRSWSCISINSQRPTAFRKARNAGRDISLRCKHSFKAIKSILHWANYLNRTPDQCLHYHPPKMSYLTTVGTTVQLIPPPTWLAHLSRFPMQPIKRKKKKEKNRRKKEVSRKEGDPEHWNSVPAELP